MTTETWQARAHRSLDRTVAARDDQRMRPMAELLPPSPLADRIAEAMALPDAELREPVACETCEDAGMVLVRRKSGETEPRPCRCPLGVGALLSQAGLSGRELDGMTMDRFHVRDEDQRRMYNAAVGFVERPEGSLALVGDKGRGKTHVAVAIVRAWCESGRRGRFVTVPDMLDELQRASMSDEAGALAYAHERLAALPLLALDDLGAEKGTEWRAEQVFRVVNARHNRRAPTVVTSNLALDQIDGRIADRLMQHRVAVCKGESYRVTGG